MSGMDTEFYLSGLLSSTFWAGFQVVDEILTSDKKEFATYSHYRALGSLRVPNLGIESKVQCLLRTEIIDIGKISLTF